MKLLRPLVKRDEFPSMSMGEWLAQAATYSFNGQSYTLPFQTTMPGQKAETIANSFEGYITGGLHGNGVIFNLASVRMRVFSEARLMFQQLRNGRPGDLFSNATLAKFERPWPGGTMGDLLALMLLHADFGGSAYVTEDQEGLALLRPDWVDIVLGERRNPVGGLIGRRKVGYAYYPTGDRRGDATYLALDEVAHFAPQPDPLANFRGMSWLTPVLREIQADGAATSHKLKFFENAATPNLAVSLPKEVTPEQFEEFVEAMDAKHKGVKDAYKTLYTGGGADVTVIGANMQQLDFKVTQGAGETRLAAAAGVPPTVANLSEGMQGSSLNAGNFGQARRQFADTTMSSLWRNAAGSLEILTKPPSDARLWFDSRDIPFLREDQKDLAEIQGAKAVAIRQLVDAGYEPQTVTAAVNGDDFSLLAHSGLYSVQLQAPGTTQPAATPAPSGSRTTTRAALEFMQRMADETDASDERLQRVIADFSESLRGLAERDAPAVTVNVEPTPVSVNVTNDVPVPDVTVSPAEVHVDAPVSVSPVLEIPPRTRRVVRDSAGNITKVIEE